MPKKKPERNLHACHPIMRKGGVHEKSKSAKRTKAKRELQRAIHSHKSDQGDLSYFFCFA